MSDQRAGEIVSERALEAARQAGWESWNNGDHAGIGDAIRAMANAMLDALRSMPVEQRMALMGMRPDGHVTAGGVWGCLDGDGFFPTWREVR